MKRLDLTAIAKRASLIWANSGRSIPAIETACIEVLREVGVTATRAEDGRYVLTIERADFPAWLAIDLAPPEEPQGPPTPK